MMNQELLQLEGTISSIVFRNDENGYTILALDTPDGDDVTVTGCMPGVSIGESLTIHGSWTHHPTYGEQFRAEAIERRMPVSEKAILEYLSSGAVKGIGKKTARLLVNAFGENTLSVIEEHPDELAKVKGISPKRARTIHEAFLSQMAMRRLLDFLTAHNLPLQLGMLLYRQYGDMSLTVLHANPYILTEEPCNVPFPEADRLALRLDFSPIDPIRLEAGVLYTLTHNLDNGHVFLPVEKLLTTAGHLLDTDLDTLEEILNGLLSEGRVVRDSIAGQDACYLAQLYDCEVYIADRLSEMADREMEVPHRLDALLSEIEARQGIEYAPLQRKAVEMAAQRQVMLLTGGPGTGKTTSLRGILSLFEHLELKTSLAAPTGRAAKRLSESCGAEASTIHRLLEPRYDSSGSRLTFAHNERDPLDTDAIILDEASMVDIMLMQSLLAALPAHCRLVLVGDPHQLPSVGPGSLLADLIRSKRLPSLQLTEIFRQAATSAIIRGARSVDHGQCPELVNSREGDFFFLRRLNAESASQTIVELCRDRLPKNLGIPPDQIQVLSPTRKGTAGTVSLNRVLQEAVNPPSRRKKEKKYGTSIFREGDRVMQIKNNYDVMWEDESGTVGMGIFNGDIGTIRSIDLSDNIITVDFDGHIAEYTGEMMSQLEPAYAVTVHKSQGSEYTAVILSAVEAPPLLQTRGILYTAMTRARRLLIIVGDDRILTKMAENDRQQRRYSGLRARLSIGKTDFHP